MEDRKSIDQVMMETALNFANRSTCARVKAGAVISVNNHIVSTGYNGAAPGKIHCEDHFHRVFMEEVKGYLDFDTWIESEEFKEIHHKWAVRNELHAEMNAIIYSARRGIPIENGTIYTKFSPCIFCTKAIIHAGLSEVVYHTLYDREEGHMSLEVLKENDIIIKQV
jgi:dCMP deaminase